MKFQKTQSLMIPVDFKIFEAFLKHKSKQKMKPALNDRRILTAASVILHLVGAFERAQEGKN